MTARGHRLLLVVVCALMTSLLAGCAASGLSFFKDERVSIRAPGDNARVRLPVQVSWESSGFDGQYAVFFDRSPIRRGRDLLSLVPDTDPCRAEESCPTPQWLAQRDIYVVDGTELAVNALPDRRGNKRSEDRHQLTIVLLNREGRRVGEGAFVREFIVERED